MLAPPSSASAARGEGTPPNVLVIVADDLGCELLSCYGPAQDQPPTPTLDQMAAGGVVFQRAWATPNCTPSRATLQTGRYPLRTGMGSLLGGLQDTDKGPYGLPLEEITIPEMLDLGTSNAWSHACIGKWHLASDATGGYLAPNTAGYSYFAGSIGNIQAPETYFSWERVVDGVAATETGYATTVQVDDTLAWIAQASEPWFCMLNFNAPHAPLHAPPAGLHTQDLSGAGDPAVDGRPYYKAVIEAMDTEIGRLLASLGPAEPNTMIFFVGDNGTPSKVAEPALDEFKAKGTFYEGGIHVPLIAKGPLVATPGSVCDALVDLTDIWATVADIAGVSPAAVLPPGEVIDGVSLVPYLADVTIPMQKSAVFSEFFRPNATDGGLPVYTGTGTVCQTDMGFGGPGTATLSICGGPLVQGQHCDVLVSGAPPLSPAWLAGSFKFNPIPVLGGFLCPYPETYVQGVFTDANGEIFIPDLTSTLGPMEYYAQFAIFDPQQTLGFSITNAVKLTFLPSNLKAVRGDRFKLVRIYNGGDDMLYDLALDPGENVDLIAAGPLVHAAQVAYSNLDAELDAFLASF